ncbi:hypothetical protein Z517_09427 [Fonsecaea pedrosoi CBS 271.37]|uniref:Uncharacterized protein n=1 Tax=Fonsecaea pedrosoi CBS 271.37 TaxID=1442368 RepID=A0A0D2G8J2_9EURO|nr:uncharacterized protein Z517_09427 [Fonsecaea pedrosoi CBS 271.37]KIW76983.1 hypothetical protein Z517_09427 [Fonsecaea pedrosoi CBS 271.37]
MLPPPVPSSAESNSSSSSRTRKQSDAESDAEAAQRQRHASRGGTKQEILERNGGMKCWHYGRAAPDIARVISKKDNSLSHDAASGLLIFDRLGDEQNGLPLCPSCHRALDDINQPGFTFIFTELEYFIDCERQDYQNRIDTAQQQGDIPPRMVPTPQMYSEYLKREELVSSHAVGGLYRRYTLQDFFPDCCDKSFIPGLDHFKESQVFGVAHR